MKDIQSIKITGRINTVKSRKNILDFAGCLTDEENYRIMKKAIKDSRKGKSRATPINYDCFNLSPKIKKILKKLKD